MASSLSKISQTAQRKWYITIPLLSLLTLGSFKLYSNVKNFYNTFDLGVTVARVHSFDVKTLLLEAVLKVTITNHTGFDIDLNNTSSLAKSGGYLIGKTPVIPEVNIPNGTTQSFEFPMTMQLANVAANIQNILDQVDIHIKTHVFGFIPINYTYALDLQPIVAQVPQLWNKLQSIFSLFTRDKGLGYVSKTKKILQDASRFEHLYPKPEGIDIFEKRGEPKDTMEIIHKNVRKYAHQTKKISQVLKGSTLGATCQNIWNYYYQHFAYKPDEKGKEQLRTPTRAFADRANGIDCDCFTQSILCNLQNLGIKAFQRIIKRNYSNEWTHIYVVVPRHPHADLSDPNQYIVLDPVLDEYNVEPTGITDKYDKAL